jgi:hypothetical protein
MSQIENPDCYELTFHRNGNGEIDSRELAFKRAGQNFKIIVGTPEFIASLKRWNDSLPLEMQAMDKILPVNPPLPEVAELCPMINSQPWKNVAPFATPHEISE